MRMASAPRMRPFSPATMHSVRRAHRRLLMASIVVAIVGGLVASLDPPGWGHALPALLISGPTLPL
jgi:hypothetical protein